MNEASTTESHGIRVRPPSHSPPDVPYAPGISLARMLGWFSIGLGAAELLMPSTIESASGVQRPNVLRAYGLREIITGVGILRSRQPRWWMWARVAGDAIDLATLAPPLASQNRRRQRNALLATLAVAGVAVADAVCASQLTAGAALEGGGYRRHRKPGNNSLIHFRRSRS